MKKINVDSRSIKKIELYFLIAGNRKITSDDYSLKGTILWVILN